MIRKFSSLPGNTGGVMRELKISIVIRTFNEEKHIGEVLEKISMQGYSNYEVIIVDSESTDRTVEIASEYNCNIVPIRKADFDYSYASNIGIEHAGGDIVCFLSGHSVPVSNNYLYDINCIFQDEEIGGCYGDTLALPDGSLIEKIYNKLGYWKNLIISGKNKIIKEKEIHPGILSCSNACVRTNLAKKHPFAKELGKGGEDVGMAWHIIQDGYYIARVPQLLVLHSHGSGLNKFLDEHKEYKRMWADIEKYIREQR